MDTNTLIIAVVTGAIGTGYLMYGKSQQMIVPILSGIILCVYPYFITNTWWLIGIGLIFVLLPFILRV